MNIVPTLIPVSDLQRDSARIVNLAMTDDKPVIIIRNNKPTVAIVDVLRYQKMLNKIEALEREILVKDLQKTEADFKAGKLKYTTNFSEFLDD